jgi:SAM-dependent methyltransferase
MRSVLQCRGGGARILDIPAGNGLLGDRLRALGYDVVQADINDERSEFIYANMERELPFADDSFDVVLCLEGIEHVTTQQQLLKELVRVTRPGGWIVISTPNISNFYSRLTFLFTGHFHQFDPRNFGFAESEAIFDKFHITPISLYYLAYAMAANNARLVCTRGDRFKKKVLMPLALLLWPVIVWNERRVERGLNLNMRSSNAELKGLFFNMPLYLSRSLVAKFQKD